MVVFRRYRPGDEVGIVGLLRTCFRSYGVWGLTVDDWVSYESSDYGFRRDLALVAEEGGKIVGHVQLVVRRLRVGVAYVDTGGIANVSTHPEYRRRGIATSLMKLALEVCRKFGLALSSLLTEYGSAGYRVYRSLGYADTFTFYEFVGARDRVERALDVLSGGPDLEFEELDEERIEEVARVYDIWSSRFSGMVWRPLEYWRARVLEKTFYHSFLYDERDSGVRVVALDGGRVVGYALGLVASRMRRGVWPREEGVVLEVAAIDGRYLRSVLREVLRRLIAEDVRVVRLFVPYVPELSDVLDMFERFSGSVYMDYVIDQYKLCKQLEPELRRRVEEVGLAVSTSIDLCSPYGCARIDIDKGYVEILPSTVPASNKVHLSRDGITRLIYGVYSFSDVLLRSEVEFLSCDKAALRVLHTLFPRRIVYISQIDTW